MQIVEYLTENGDSPFAAWFDRLDGQAAAKVTTALIRLGHGNTSNVESVGGGVYENKIDFGPRLPRLLRNGGNGTSHPGRGRDQETPVAGHRRGQGALGRLQEAQATGAERT